MPAKDLVPFSTYLPPEVKAKLEQAAVEQDRSAAAVARRILTDAVQGPRRRAPRSRQR